MTASPVAGRAPGSAGPVHPRSRAATWAVWMAGIVLAALAASYAIVGVTYAVGGADAVEDTWAGYLGGVALIGSLVGSLVAFALAVFAKVKRERSALLWLPLALFPVLFAVVVLVETFWME